LNFYQCGERKLLTLDGVDGEKELFRLAQGYPRVLLLSLCQQADQVFQKTCKRALQVVKTIKMDRGIICIYFTKKRTRLPSYCRRTSI
jgi:hypothetical protein